MSPFWYPSSIRLIRGSTHRIPNIQSIWFLFPIQFLIKSFWFLIHPSEPWSRSSDCWSHLPDSWPNPSNPRGAGGCNVCVPRLHSSLQFPDMIRLSNLSNLLILRCSFSQCWKILTKWPIYLKSKKKNRGRVCLLLQFEKVELLQTACDWACLRIEVGITKCDNSLQKMALLWIVLPALRWTLTFLNVCRKKIFRTVYLFETHFYCRFYPVWSSLWYTVTFWCRVPMDVNRCPLVRALLAPHFLRS